MISCCTGRLALTALLVLLTGGPRVESDFSGGKCGAVQYEDAELVITVGLHEYGAELRVENDHLIYANTLFHIPTLSRMGIVRKVGVAIPLECRYQRTHFASSQSQLSLVNSTPTTPDNSIPDRSMFDMVASVLSARHSALKLFLDRCVVTLGPDTAATPSCDLINHHGCADDSRSSEPTISWADGHVLRLKLNLLQSLRDDRCPDSSVYPRPY